MAWNPQELATFRRNCGHADRHFLQCLIIRCFWSVFVNETTRITNIYILSNVSCYKRFWCLNRLCATCVDTYRLACCNFSWKRSPKARRSRRISRSSKSSGAWRLLCSRYGLAHMYPLDINFPCRRSLSVISAFFEFSSHPAG